MEVKVALVKGSGKLPTKGTPGSAGWDVYASEGCVLAPGEWKKVDLGIRLEMPSHLCALLIKRSGMAATFGVCGQEGLIDSDYRGIVGMTLVNHSNQPYHVRVGERIGQLLFLPRVHLQLCRARTLQPTQRGVHGFGSTGK